MKKTTKNAFYECTSSIANYVKGKKTYKMVYASFCSAIVVQSAHIFKITISNMHLKRGLHKYAR